MWGQPTQTNKHVCKNGLTLNPDEFSYYQMLYSQLDPQNIGQVNGRESVNFFKMSGLPVDMLKKVWIESCSNNSAALDRDEFFTAMRYIAYAQNGIDVSQQSIKNNTPVALPRFQGISLPQPQTQIIQPTISQQIQPMQISQPQSPPASLISHMDTQNSQYDISPEQLAKFETYYLSQDPKGQGFISGQDARNLFMKSQLPQEILKHIWFLCDYENKGHLRKGEFILALHFIALCKKGIQLPPQVPENLSHFLSHSAPSSVIISQGIQGPQSNNLVSLNQTPQVTHQPQMSHAPTYSEPTHQKSNLLDNIPEQPQHSLLSDSQYRNVQNQQQEIQAKLSEIVSKSSSAQQQIIKQCIEEKKREIEYLDQIYQKFVNIQNHLIQEESELQNQLIQLEQQKQQKQNQINQIESQVMNQANQNNQLRNQVFQQQSQVNQIASSPNPQTYQPQPVQKSYSYQETFQQSQQMNQFPPMSNNQQMSGMNTQLPSQTQAQQMTQLSIDDDFSDYQAKKQRIASNNQSQAHDDVPW